MTDRLAGKLLAAAAAFGLSACASPSAGDGAVKIRSYGGYKYAGSNYAGPLRVQEVFAGYGGDLLDPWLVHTEEGRDIVRIAYADPRRLVSGHQGRRANRWFREFADTNDDRELTDAEIKAGLVRGKLYHYARFFNFD